ncbi:MAG: hypothetical protein WED59_05295 [Candidatus Woykebacteria bacterium]
MKKSSWLDMIVTEVEAEVWRLRFDPDRLLTQSQIAAETGHKSVGNQLTSALRRLQARGPGLPPSSEEQELIDLALLATGAKNLEQAYQTRNEQVRRLSLATRHRIFHDSQR